MPLPIFQISILLLQTQVIYFIWLIRSRLKIDKTQILKSPSMKKCTKNHTPRNYKRTQNVWNAIRKNLNTSIKLPSIKYFRNKAANPCNETLERERKK